MYLLLLYPNVEDYLGSDRVDIQSHSNMVINPGTTPALTSTTLALRKDTLVYPGP